VWKEKEKPLEKCRTARNVKVCSIPVITVLPLYSLLTHLQVFIDNQNQIVEVLFFIHLCYKEEEKALMLIFLFSSPDLMLL